MTQIVAQTALSAAAYAFGSVTLPDFNNVLGEWWFGESNTASRTNLITGVASTMLGTPVFGAGYARMGYIPSGSNGGISGAVGYRTDIKVPNAYTWIALVRPGYNVPAIAALNLTDGYQYISNMLISIDPSRFSLGNGGVTGASDQAILAAPDATKFNFVMGTAALNEPGRIWTVSEIGTAFDQGGSEYLPSSRPDALINLGALADNNFQGWFDLAAFAVLTGEKGETYAEAVYPMWKAFAEQRGLTVA